MGNSQNQKPRKLKKQNTHSAELTEYPRIYNNNSTIVEDEKLNLLSKSDLENINFNAYEKFIDIEIKKNMGRINVQSLSENNSITENFILKYPTLNWDFYQVSKKNLSNVFFDKFLKDNFYILLTNPFITINYLKKIGVDLSILNDNAWDSLSLGASLTADDIKKYSSKINFMFLSSNVCINTELVLNNIQYPWNLEKLYGNPSFNVNYVDIINESFSQIMTTKILNWVLDNPNLKMEIIEKYKHLFDFYNVKSLSKFKNLPLQFIIDNQNLPWNWDYISEYNLNLTIEFIQQFSDKLNFVLLSKNPCVTLDIITKYPKLNWDIKVFSLNPSLTEKLIEKNINILNIDNLSKNTALVPSIIYKFPNLRWNFEKLQTNSMEIGLRRHGKFTFLEGSIPQDSAISNSFFNNRSLFDTNLVKEIINYY